MNMLARTCICGVSAFKIALALPLPSSPEPSDDEEEEEAAELCTPCVSIPSPELPPTPV
jgi:hypothetical protein